MESIPFHIDSVHGGFSNCAGFLHFDDDVLRFEYRTNVGGLGLKTSTREAAISLDEIQSIDFKRGWFGAKAILRPNRLKVLERVPGSHDDSISIQFRRRDRLKAEYFMSEVTLRLSESRLAAASETDF